MNEWAERQFIVLNKRFVVQFVLGVHHPIIKYTVHILLTCNPPRLFLSCTLCLCVYTSTSGEIGVRTPPF